MRSRRREHLLRSRILGPAIVDQVDEEIDLHVELLVRELMEEGMSERQARAAAAERFRDRGEMVVACRKLARGTERRLRWGVSLDELRQDLGYALRQLVRAPAFTAMTILTLAAGLGATTAIFSVVESVVLRAPGQHALRPVAVGQVEGREIFCGEIREAAAGSLVVLIMGPSSLVSSPYSADWV
ncbi:MAG TPA: hypothetical protein VHQ90_22865 [Thermoanaerobaculia bacterium]|nr:hypothetical protein [Thermoanaerobaculia bacterium]